MNIRFVVLFMSGLIFFNTLPGNCVENSDYTQKTRFGTIDWTNGMVLASGTGAPPDSSEEARPLAIRKAKTQAYQNLMKTVSCIRIDESKTVADEIMKNDILAGRLEEMVRHADTADVKYLSDGTIAVALQIRIRESFSSLILPKYVQQFESINVVQSPENEETSPEEAYSGLIVDAREIKLQPAICFRIWGEDGQILYSSGFVSREYAVQRGMCGYTRSMEAALKDTRVGPHPLVIKGTKERGGAKSDILVNHADALMVRKSVKHFVFLKECRVIVVLD